MTQATVLDIMRQSLLEAALEMEMEQPDISRLGPALLGEVAEACHNIGSQIAEALEGLQRSTIETLCAYTHQQVVEGALPTPSTWNRKPITWNRYSVIEGLVVVGAGLRLSYILYKAWQKSLNSSQKGQPTTVSPTRSSREFPARRVRGQEINITLTLALTEKSS
ncbi:MAG: hypothetical protein Q9224_004252 [Gallowayella concinna]